MALAHRRVGYHSTVYFLTDPRPEAEKEEGEEETKHRSVFRAAQYPSPQGR